MDEKNNQKTENYESKENSNFFKAIQLITIFGMFICFLIIIIINILGRDATILVDIKSIISNILVGLFFSFLVAIKGIRDYILNSVASFMGQEEYLKKLNPNELERIRDKAYNIKYNIDMTSNQESLFNHLKKLDEHLTLPHKSTVNEQWVINTIKDEPDFYQTKRIQDYRIHTLDKEESNVFQIIYKNSAKIKKDHVSIFEDNFNLEIYIEGKKEVHIKNLNEKEKCLTAKYNEDSMIYEISIIHEVKLEKEFTQVKVISDTREEKDNSIALVSKTTTYGLNYNIKLPKEANITNIYHNDTLYSEEKKQVTSDRLSNNQISLNINGWQLPGLIFVVTYEI
ncbi:hypothetical protein CRU96_05790 [Malaciobacter halophilus]|nr:hypothetical protein [Malaciobacter halophilus]RYA23919.1 hypothetical protein CRU96_05790 [Malaciobacter halophilus]